MLYVTLPEAKLHLNKTSSADDVEITDLTNAAEQTVLGMTGPIAAAGPVVETQVPYRGTVLLAGPATSITSVVDEWSTPVAVTDYTVDLAAGVIEGIPRWGAVTVTYVAKGSPLDVVRTAIFMVLGRLWETQRGNAPALPAGEGPVFTPGMGGIITEVRALLAAAGLVRPVTA